ncbi:MAG: hypothetical protein WKG06_36975 [Segetibacter sp.]
MIIDWRGAELTLKKFGLLENSSRGIWALSQPDINISTIDPDEIKRTVREQARPTITKTGSEEEQKKQTEKEVEFEVETSENWKQQLLNILYNISPSAFERLAQRILRKAVSFK